MDSRLKTFLVVGPAHAGTSLIAGTLHKLGVPMGSEWNSSPGTYEDSEFYKAKTQTEVLDIVLKRNEQHGVWGVKYLPITKCIWSMHMHIRNPHYVVAYREMASTKFHDYLHKEWGTWEKYWKSYGFWANFISATFPKALVVVYEKAIQSPKYLIQELITFGNLEPTEDQIDNALRFNTQGKGYNA